MASFGIGLIGAGPFVPEVVLDFPDAVRELHPMFRAEVAAKDAAFLHSWIG